MIAESDWGLDEQSTQILATRERAVETADTMNREAAGQAPLYYRVYVLHELDESAMWDWATSSVAHPNPMVYVNERAARASLYAGCRLWRRRAGTAEWQEVPTRG